MVDRLGIRVRVMGDMELIPEKTRIAIDKVVEYSRNNTKYAREDEKVRGGEEVRRVRW